MTIFEEAESLINGDRQDDYGKPSKNIKAIAIAWSAYLRQRFKHDDIELDAWDLGWLNNFAKGMRDANRRKRDNAVDACAYLRLPEMCDFRKEAERRDIPTTTDESAQPDMSDDKKTCPKVGDTVMVNGIEMTLKEHIGQDHTGSHWDAVYPGGDTGASIFLNGGKWHYVFDENTYA